MAGGRHVCHHVHPCGGPARRVAVVDGTPLDGGALVGAADRVYATLEFEGGRDAVESLQALSCDAEAVAVHVDEARCDHPAGHVEHAVSVEWLGADGTDGAPVDPDVEDAVGSAVGIDHAAAVEYQFMHG